jgi:hypothetical protein
MNHDHPIHYLRRREIDTGKWDRRVKNAPNGWLYAWSFFLDGIGDWDALVMGDYDYIMPLPKKRKFGIRYIYIPPFTGQLGIIGAGEISTELTARFIRNIPKTFSVADLLMNEQNPSLAPTGPPFASSTSAHTAPPDVSPSPTGAVVPVIPPFTLSPGISIFRRTNYILPLREEYATLSDRYSQDAKKNIRRTTAAGLSPLPGISMATVTGMYRAAYGEKNRNISAAAYRRFEALGEVCITQGNGFTIGVRAPDGQLLASAFFGKDDKRIYYILGAPTREGRSVNAVHCLVDEVIKKFAGTGLVFDFEGSDIPSVSQFYRKFSPDAMQYDLIRINRLPRWLQKIRNRWRDPATPDRPDSSHQNSPNA